MPVPRGDPTLQARRVRAPPEPVGVVVRFEDHRFGPAHAPQYLDTGLTEVRRHRDCATSVGHPNPVGQGVVRDSEEGRRKVSDGAGLSGEHGVRAEGLTYARRGEYLDVVIVYHRAHAASVVGVSVGQQDGVHSGEVSADTVEEGRYAPPRETGVDEEAARIRLHVGRIARASARKNTQPQNLSSIRLGV